MSWETSNKNTCNGKKTFASFREANEFENRVHKRGSVIRAKGKKIEKLHAYKCLSCQQIHLGHPARRSRPRLYGTPRREAYRRSDKRLYLP